MMKEGVFAGDKYLCQKNSFPDEKNPRWKGGRSAGYILKLCKNIKAKDKCRICKTKQNLFYHHKDGNRMNNKPENIQIICKPCHATLHTRIKNILNVKGWQNKSGKTRSKLIQEGKLIALRNAKGYFIGWEKLV